MATPNVVPINASNNGDNVLVAAVASQIIQVTGFLTVAAGAVIETFKTGTGAAGSNVALTGPMTLATGIPIGMPPTVGGRDNNQQVLFETAPGEALNLFLSSGVQVSGFLLYRVSRH